MAIAPISGSSPSSSLLFRVFGVVRPAGPAAVAPVGQAPGMDLSAIRAIGRVEAPEPGIKDKSGEDGTREGFAGALAGVLAGGSASSSSLSRLDPRSAASILDPAAAVENSILDPADTAAENLLNPESAAAKDLSDPEAAAAKKREDEAAGKTEPGAPRPDDKPSERELLDRLAELYGEKARNEGRQRVASGNQSMEESRVLAALSARDAEVRAHEAAHVGAGGRYVRGGASYSYQRGPDGRQYAVGGEVGIDASPVPGKPEDTLAKMRIVRAAALAPAQPSGADLAVAAGAAQAEGQAIAEIAAARRDAAAAPEAATPAGQAAAPGAARAYAVEAGRGSADPTGAIAFPAAPGLDLVA